MLSIRPSAERGKSTTEWLTSYHTFSFADYYDPHWMGRGYLRVINEDIIQPGQGFALHPHRDMEIITYVIRGALQHQDSLGNGSIIKPGEIQRMSAGTGVRHSEFNASHHEALHLLQIWIQPEQFGLAPGYEQQQIQRSRNELIVLGAPHPTHPAVKIHQNITLYAGYFDKNTVRTCQLQRQDAWLQLIQGQLDVNGCQLHAGDAIWIQDEDTLRIECRQDAEFILFNSW